MRTHWIDDPTTYDGSQLRAHWVLSRTGIVGDPAGIFRDIANNDFALERSVRSRTSRCAGAARCVAVRAQVAAGAARTHQ